MSDTTLKLLLLGRDLSASRTLKGVGDAADKTHGKLGKVGGGAKIAGGLMAGALVGGAVAAAGAIVDFGGDSVKAFQDAEKSQRKLEDAYKRYPALADVSIGKQRELAQAIQDKTGADGDDIAAGQAVLAQYKLTGSQVSQLTPLLVDYAAKTGKDMPTAAKSLGKALSGSGKALKDAGVTFKDTGSAAGNFDVIMKGLRTNVGGFAAQEATSLEGKSKMLETKFGDLEEKVGGALVPSLEKLTDAGIAVMDWLDANPELVDGLMTAFGALGDILVWVAGVVYKALLPTLKSTMSLIAMVTEGVSAMVTALSNMPGMDWLKPAAKGLADLATGARKVSDGINSMPDTFEFSTKKPVAETNKSTLAVQKLKQEIKTLKGKIVEAKAKGDHKQVDVLQGKMNRLKSKLVKAEANAKGGGAVDTLKGKIDKVRGKTVTVTAKIQATGTASWTVRSIGGKIYANANAYGAIRGLRRFAAGGIENHTANIYGPGDGIRMFNEPETQGESYIPLANDARRPRALAIWRETGRLIGAYAGGGIAGRAPMPGGGVNVTINANVARGADPLAFAREVEQELVKLSRTRGGRLAFA